MGESVDSVRGMVQTGLEIAFGALGDFMGATVTAALMGAAGLTLSAWTGPMALTGGTLAFGIGYMIADQFPAKQLAAAMTEIFFWGYEQLDALEDDLQSSLSDIVRDTYNDWVRGLLPDDYEGPIPEASPQDGPTNPVTLYRSQLAGVEVVDDVTVVHGDFRYDVANFEHAAGSVTVDLGIVAVQDGGALGEVRFYTVEGLRGSAFDDILVGNFADNELRGGAGNDVLDGQEGFDFADYRDAGAGVSIDLRNTQQTTADRGVDQLISIEGVLGSEHNDQLTGNDTANTLLGGFGDDLLNGGGGDDLIYAHGVLSGLNLERDAVDGGTGFDTISFSAETMAPTRVNRPAYSVTVDLTIGVASFGTSADRYQATLASIEGVVGSGMHDVITGNAGANHLRGEGGSDVISGGAGDDYIDGGSGFDTLDGGDGIDTLSLFSSAVGVTATLAGGKVVGDTVSNFENLFGSRHHDILSGSAVNNVVSGSAGDDYLDGGAGDDVLRGGGDNDTLVGGTGADTLVGGTGIDVADYSGATTAVTVRLDLGFASGGGGADTLTDVENVRGSAYDDVIFGSSEANVIYGGAGRDVILGLGGNDVILAGAGAANEIHGGEGDDYFILEAADTVVEEALNQGKDTVEARISAYVLGANVENLIFGGQGNFSGTGNASNNLIIGGAGDDWLTGGGGMDKLLGGDGFDTLSVRGVASEYSIVASEGGFLIQDLVAGRDGTMLVSAIEQIRFNNGATTLLTIENEAML